GVTRWDKFVNSAFHCPCRGLSESQCTGNKTYHKGSLGLTTVHAWGTGDDVMLVEDGSCGDLEVGTATCGWRPPPGGPGPCDCTGITPTTPVEGMTLKRYKLVECEET